MPLAFLIIGAVLILVAIRGTHANLGTLLKDDFTGSGAGQGHSFLIWIAAIAGVGALGYVPAMKVPARLLLGLVILALLISNQGFFQKLRDGLSAAIPGVTVTQAQADPTAQPLPTTPLPVQVSGTSGSSGAGTAGDALGAASKIIPFIGGL